MIRSIGRGVILTALLCGSSAWANFTKLDDFERTTGTNMGPNWTERDLDFSIAEVSGNKVAVALDYALMTYDGDLQGLSPANDWFVVAAMHNGEMTPQFAALVLRYADAANSAFVKLQDNNGDGLFDYIIFLRGGPSGGTTWTDPGGSSFALPITTPTNQANLRVRVADDPINAGMLQVIVQLDANHNGIWGEAGDDEFVRGNLDPAGLGNGVGLAGTGGARMDDFGGEIIPEPATVALLLCGGLTLLRRRKRSC
jgi:hypothetical protein